MDSPDHLIANFKISVAIKYTAADFEDVDRPPSDRVRKEDFLD
jgi:hypothetical protein